MPSLLGKRKSQAVEDPEAVADAQERLRRHFEAQFKPLAVAPLTAPKKTTRKQNHNDSDSSEDDNGSDAGKDSADSEWDGVSGDEEEEEDKEGKLLLDGAMTSGTRLTCGTHTDTPVVEVVDHSTASTDTTKMSKRELKAYLSSRPPDPNAAAAQTSTNTKKTASDGDQPEDSAAFLANDLALQRLIAESHILSASGGNSSHWQSEHAAGTAANTRAFAAGRTARKTTDMRVQALGAKGSILSQAKMPMSMRKGIVGTAADKEAKRRKEARENGIILEREAKKAKTKSRPRGDRPVDLPAVGRMRGAELRVSAREASAIAASARRPEARGRGKRRR
ncbi:pre-rRNA processing and 40S ribosomal subunit assembly [Collariella sp. IMI 366227]|nr:pre-rRNA processing and 40S ribosomal subunit assembly [Collariella sp. IMI 366227]